MMHSRYCTYTNQVPSSTKMITNVSPMQRTQPRKTSTSPKAWGWDMKILMLKRPSRWRTKILKRSQRMWTSTSQKGFGTRFLTMNMLRLKERGAQGKSLTASQSSSVGWVWPTLDFTQSTRQNLNDSHRKADTRKVNYSSCRKTYYRKAKYRKAAHRKANFISSKVNSETPIELTCPINLLKWIKIVLLLSFWEYIVLLSTLLNLCKKFCWWIYHCACQMCQWEMQQLHIKILRVKAWNIAPFKILCKYLL